MKNRCNLIRFGINAEIIDNRNAKTPTGRADSLQPKTIETLKQMRLADRLLLKGVKVHDVRCWVSRIGRVRTRSVLISDSNRLMRNHCIELSKNFSSHPRH